MPRVLILALAVLSLFWLPACGGSGCCDGAIGPGDPPIEQAPTFLLEDVNASSATFTQLVSPRAFLGGISAWYFGQAT